MNCAARTTLSPSVGPKHLYLACVRLCLETPCSFSWLNTARTISQKSHVSRTMALGRILDELESEWLWSGFHVMEASLQHPIIVFRPPQYGRFELSPLSTIVDSGFDSLRHTSSPYFPSPIDSTVCFGAKAM
jgi:hypothetical protein